MKSVGVGSTGRGERETEQCDGVHVDFLVKRERNSKGVEPVQTNSATDSITCFVKTASIVLIVQLMNSDKHPEWNREAPLDHNCLDFVSSIDAHFSEASVYFLPDFE